MDTNLAGSTGDLAAAREGNFYGQSLTLASAAQALWRRRFLIGAIIALLTGLAIAYAALATPRYTSSVQLILDGQAGPIFNIEAAIAGQPQDQAGILSEIDVIRSYNLAGRVTDKLDLMSNPEFNVSLQPEPALLAAIREYLPVVAGWIDRLGSDDQERTIRDRTIDEVRSRLRVSQLPQSRTIQISFTSESPKLAAQIANTWADSYLVARLEDRLSTAQRKSSWLSARVAALRESVEESERVVERYRKEHGLFTGERVSLLTEQVSDLTSRLTEATIGRRAAEANLSQARRLAAGSQDISTAAQVLQSDLIVRFRQEEAALERREAEMSENLGPRHPQMIQIQAERARLRDSIRLQINKIVRGLENELAVARDREQALSNDLNSLKAKVADSNRAAIGLRDLERDAEAKRLLLDRFLANFTESSSQEDRASQVTGARLISPALVPEKPTYPRTGMLIGLALVASTVLAMIAAFIVEYFDKGYRSAEQIERDTGLPVIAHVPLVSAAQRRGKDVTRYVLSNPSSAYAEAVRGLYTRCLLTLDDKTPKSILFVSSEAGEGKTSLSMSLARQQAAAGRKVVLLDIDFRRSPVSKLSGLTPEPGLSDVLIRRVRMADVVRRDPGSAADIIVAGKPWLSHESIAASPAFKELLSELRRHYQLIVIDAPPILAMPDVHLVSSLSDFTVLVVKWGGPAERLVQHAIGQIIKFGGRVDGAVLSMINVKKNAYYPFGDSSYYRGKAAAYYSG